MGQALFAITLAALEDKEDEVALQGTGILLINDMFYLSI